MNMTEKEAYKAMFYFLDAYYDMRPSDALGGLLGSMNLLEDGKPADAACWSDWMRAVEKVIKTTTPEEPKNK